jgi:hypothetical protein
MIELFDDFRDILIELHRAGAHFVVLGGHAVAFHGHPRATKALDVLVEADPSNAKRVYAALAAFGAPLASFEVRVEDFPRTTAFFRLGSPREGLTSSIAPTASLLPKR